MKEIDEQIKVSASQFKRNIKTSLKIYINLRFESLVQQSQCLISPYSEFFFIFNFF